jgi:hypothetical protein
VRNTRRVVRERMEGWGEGREGFTAMTSSSAPGLRDRLIQGQSLESGEIVIRE